MTNIKNIQLTRRFAPRLSNAPCYARRRLIKEMAAGEVQQQQQQEEEEEEVEEKEENEEEARTCEERSDVLGMR